MGLRVESHPQNRIIGEIPSLRHTWILRAYTNAISMNGGMAFHSWLAIDVDHAAAVATNDAVLGHEVEQNAVEYR